jgi:type II secretory pathway component PulF
MYQTRIQINAVNPGGEHLSVSEMPYKTLYAVTTAIWALFAILWTGNWFLYRGFNVKLQRLITVVPVVHSLVALFQLMQWMTKSQSGLESPELYVSLTALHSTSTARHSTQHNIA